MPATAVHPALMPLMAIVGQWSGVGKGYYPTIEPFEYREECTFEVQTKKPLLSYQQRTFHASSGAVLHQESGWLRAVPQERGSRVELVVADATGAASILEGDVAQDGDAIVLTSSSVATAGTCKEVKSLECRFEFSTDNGVPCMRRTLSMAAVGQELQPHLECDLRRSKAPVLQLEASEVLERIAKEDTVLLDVREPRETSAEPLSMAVAVPMGEACATWTSDGSPAHEAIFKHRHVIVTCRSGRRSQAAIDYFMSSAASDDAPFQFYNAVGGSNAIRKLLAEKN